MRSSSLWIIRVALTVQFLAVLAVPAAVAAAESPRAIWMAEWLNSWSEPVLSERWTSLSEDRRESNGRTIGILRLHDGMLSFAEVSGQAEWSIDIASVRRVSNHGRTMTIESSTGERYLMAIMEPNLTQGSPKNAVRTIDRAMQQMLPSTR